MCLLLSFVIILFLWSQTIQYQHRYKSCANAVQAALALHQTEDTAAELFIHNSSEDLKEVYKKALELRIQFNALAKECVK